MTITPQTMIDDLENYLDFYDLKLSKEARTILYNIELAASLHDDSPSEMLYVSEIIKGNNIIRKALEQNNCSPDLAVYLYRKNFIEFRETGVKYGDVSNLYSDIERRDLHANTYILDKAIETCIKGKRRVITSIDLFKAVIDFCMVINPSFDNGGLSDERLHVPYTTLSHFLCEYNNDMFIKVDDIIKSLDNIKGNLEG